MNLSPKLILIDLDGTLVDTVPDLTDATDAMMAQINMPQRGEDKVRNWVGNGIDRLVKRALIDKLDGEPEEALFQTAIDKFKQLYEEVNGKYSQPYPGVIDGLEWMTSQGFTLACITNKAEQFTIPLLKATKLYDYFRLVISGDTLPKKKPDPLPLLHAAKFFGVDPHHALMLGDSISDVKAARAAEFNIICVSYGYNHGVDIRTAEPDVVVDSLNELSSILKSSS